MARLPRYTLAGCPQHVIQRGNNRSAIFSASADYRAFRSFTADACARYGCRLHAYVLMTNHVHLLMTPSDADATARTMQSVCGRYAQYFNRLHGRTGTLWEGRYRATVIEAEAYLLACYRYIELNPVRAGLVPRPFDYPWSSHRANAFGRPDPLVSPHEGYLALGVDDATRRAEYRALLGAALEEPTHRAIREATSKGWALGGAPFRHEIEALLDRRTEPRKPGPPARRERSRPRSRQRSGSDPDLGEIGV
jgi:putative transposase